MRFQRLQTRVRLDLLRQSHALEVLQQAEVQRATAYVLVSARIQGALITRSVHLCMPNHHSSVCTRGRERSAVVTLRQVPCLLGVSRQYGNLLDMYRGLQGHGYHVGWVAILQGG